MLSIFICEDDDIQRQKLQEIIENYIMIEELNMEVVLSTDDPCEMIHYLEKWRIQKGIYFLDIELNHALNGIELASKIRKLDHFGKIIFVTTHDEFAPLTFIYKTEALDYIIKDEIDTFQKRVLDSLNHAQNHFYSDQNNEEEFLKVKVGNQIQVISLKDLMFIETSSNSHKLLFHLENRIIHSYDKIVNYDIYPENLFRSHKSYLINLDNILSFNKTERSCIMKNGEYAMVSARKIKLLQKKLFERKETGI